MPPGPYRRRILDAELDELMGSLSSIAIEGPKAVGKTATASQRAETTYELDDAEQRAIVEADMARIIESPPPVLIDEWQYLPPIWDKVRRADDRGAAPGNFLLTGSAAPEDTGTHSGGGRIVALRMRPLSVAERIDDDPTVSLADLLHGSQPKLGGKTKLRVGDYTDEILRSGFPAIRELSGRALRTQLDSYLARIVDRDFPELGHRVRDAAGLRRWMQAYAAASSTSTTFEKIRNAATPGEESKPSRATVQPYRNALSRLFILDEVPGWQPTRNHISELATPPKHQLADPALAARLLGATADSLLNNTTPEPSVPRDGTLLGALFESLTTLSVRVYAQGAEAEVSHLRTHRGDHEVDLIVERADGRVVALEVKLNPDPDKDAIKNLSWLKEQIGDDLLDALVITTGSEAYRRKDGVGIVPLALLGP